MALHSNPRRPPRGSNYTSHSRRLNGASLPPRRPPQSTTSCSVSQRSQTDASDTSGPSTWADITTSHLGSQISSDIGSDVTGTTTSPEYGPDTSGWDGTPPPMPVEAHEQWPSLDSKTGNKVHEDLSAKDMLHDLARSSPQTTLQPALTPVPRRQQNQASRVLPTGPPTDEAELIDLGGSATAQHCQAASGAPNNEKQPYKPSPPRESPVRPRTFHEIDQEEVQRKVAAQEAFMEPLKEPSLVDGGLLNATEAMRAAEATMGVAVESKRKGKGKKKKEWLNLTPFIQY
ncbi:uncharacterized protein AB675_11615 [Cyphellophora attinorum]|uniref:Uncharacterized protein n=1 Tax=Cyphellophora attinorum TaxID=1664694 RepID=A0A0N0NHF8_9EURO|nr:uncharacterized protein AB675_11615 [Phialophora attinorum]KPI34641.1 hypothetical protein AB675_11615 [Phialophora attinorum]